MRKVASSRKRVVFMFGGQGSQYVQMGRELFETNDVFRGWMLRAEAICEQVTSRSLLGALYGANLGADDDLSALMDSHPAIFAVEYALARALVHAGLVPDVVLGYSLGELAAAAFSGAWSFEDALRIVLHQASRVVSRCEPGGMLAVMAGADRVMTELAPLARCELASVNFDDHCVIAGLEPELRRAEAWLRGSGLAYARLPVSHAFHSRWIEPALDHAGVPRGIGEPRRLRWPLLSCCNAELRWSIDWAHVHDVVRQPVRFAQALARLGAPAEHVFVDVTPSATLAVFVKHAAPGISRDAAQGIITRWGDAPCDLGEVVRHIERVCVADERRSESQSCA